MLFLISSAPDTNEFKTAFQMAKDVNAEICLLQNAVYASRGSEDENFYVIHEDLQLRGIRENEISCRTIDYEGLIDLMTKSDRVVGLF